MQTNRSYFGLAARTAAVSLFLAGTASLAHAQQTPASASDQTVQVAAAESPALNLTAPASSSSSSDAASVDFSSASHFSLTPDALDSSQPPPRRRYGRPNYADSHTNPDGSSKFAFMAGGGASMPVMDTSNYLTPSYAFQVGGGRNWSKHFGVLLQFDYDHFGFQGNVLNNQSNFYFGANSQTTGLDGTSHIWSFTLDPTFTLSGGDKAWGSYLVGGVGFYHKVADFTIPEEEVGYSFYGPVEYQANEIIDDYTSNAFGLNGGAGITYKPSRFAGERLYMEARIVWMDNQPRTGYNATTNPNSTNYYPPNSNQTYYIPVTVGLRF